MITFVNQIKSPEAYNECYECLGGKVKSKLGVEVGVIDNGFPSQSIADVNQGNCFADVNDKSKGETNGNQGNCFADVNDKLLPSLSDDAHSDRDDTILVRE